MAERVPLSLSANKNRVLIDLTDDHEPTDYLSNKLTQERWPFVTTLAYRSSTVPEKRSSLDISEDVSDTSSDAHHKLARRPGKLPPAHQKETASTPSRSPTVPQKRRSLDISEDVSDTSSDAHHKLARRLGQLPPAHQKESASTPSRSPTVPQKRRSLDISEDVSDTSSDAHHKLARRLGQLPPAHQKPSAPTPSRSPTVPQKRNSLDRSGDLSDTSSDAPRKFARRRRQLSPDHRKPSTPAPPSLPSSQKISVVIPSPTTKQRRDIALAKRKTNINGMDNEIFPTTEEDEIIAKAAYPLARNRIDCRSVPLRFSPPPGRRLTPKLQSFPAHSKGTRNAKPQRDHLAKLSHTLKEKLRRTAGPAVTANIDCPKLLAKLADNFEFVNSYQYRAGVERIADDSEFNVGCACNGNKNGCNPSDCDCLNKEEDSEDRIVPYQISESNPKLIVATKDFLRRKAIIYECNSRCGCNGDRCWNHVVQKGRSVRLEIFDTGARGFGLRSPDFLHRGQYIDLYLGEVITKAEAEERENLTDGSHTQSYLFSLDWNIKDDEDEDRNMKVVDGRKFGSATRFMNHSCNPNCKIVPVSTTNHADEYLYNLAFFANRDIAPGTELTFDYNQGEEKTASAKADPDALPCLCGEANCRGQLWPNKRKGQGSKP